MFNNGGEMIDYWMGATPMGHQGEPEELGALSFILIQMHLHLHRVVYLLLIVDILHYRNIIQK